MTINRQKWFGPERVTWLLFAVAVVGVYLFALDIPLLGPDEPRYAQVAREMYQRGDWITPTLGGHNWFEKPALLYWLQIVSYNIFGVTEFAARLGPALFGLGTVAALFLLGKSVQSSEFRVQGSEFEVQGSEFRVQSSEFRVQSSEFRVQGSEFRVQSSEFRARGSAGDGENESPEAMRNDGITNPEPATLNPQPATPNPQPATPNPEPATLNPEPGTRNPQPGTRNPEPATLNPEPETLNSELPSELGPWFALTAATCLGLLVFSRGASFDIIITFPVTASLVGFFIYDSLSRLSPITHHPSPVTRDSSPVTHHPSPITGNPSPVTRHPSPLTRHSSPVTRHLSLSAFYFFIGVGLLAKGLIGIVFPVSIVIFYLLLSRRWPNRRLVLSLLWGIPLSLAVASLWYVPMLMRHGWEFFNVFFLEHHFQRFTSNKYRHPGPFWYFWAILPAMTIPWIPYFAAAVWRYVRKKVFQRKTAGPLDFVAKYPDLLRFSMAWMLVPLVFFSMSGSKLPGYILPALPPAAVFISVYLWEFAGRSKWRRLVIDLTAFSTLLSVVLVAAFILPGFARNDSVKHMIETADKRGFSNAPILNVHTVSYNAEFYGAGRLVREKNGQLWRFLGVYGVVQYIEENGGAPVLILIPHEFEDQFTKSKLIKTEVLDRDAELSLVSVSVPE